MVWVFGGVPMRISLEAGAGVDFEQRAYCGVAMKAQQNLIFGLPIRAAAQTFSPGSDVPFVAAAVTTAERCPDNSGVAPLGNVIILSDVLCAGCNTEHRPKVFEGRAFRSRAPASKPQLV